MNVRNERRAGPIFIGGQRRSGTTLMRTLLARHPHIARIPESHFFQEQRFGDFFEELLERYRGLFDRIGVGQEEMDGAVGAFIDSLFTHHRARKGASRWVEKSPENILRIDYLFRLFPDAQFIHMIRDPRDTLCSMKQQAAAHKPNWTKFTAEVTAPEWVRGIDAGLKWREQDDRYLEVYYEQLVSEPEFVVRRVLDFLQEPWCSTVLDWTDDRAPGTKGGNDHRALFTGSVGRWRRELSRSEVDCIQEIAGDRMTLVGYAQVA